MNEKNLTVTNQKLFYTQAISSIEDGRQNIIDAIYKETTKSYYLLGLDEELF